MLQRGMRMRISCFWEWRMLAAATGSHLLCSEQAIATASRRAWLAGPRSTWNNTLDRRACVCDRASIAICGRAVAGRTDVPAPCVRGVVTHGGMLSVTLARHAPYTARAGTGLLQFVTLCYN